MAGKSPTPGYALAGCGCFLALIAIGVTLFGAFHVFLDPRGKISGSEAMPALIGGAVCTLPLLLVVVLGVFLAMQAKKAPAGEAQQPPA